MLANLELVVVGGNLLRMEAWSLPESGSVQGWRQARLSRAIQDIGSAEIVSPAVGFGARNRWSLAFAFSFPYY